MKYGAYIEFAATQSCIGTNSTYIKMTFYMFKYILSIDVVGIHWYTYS